jgi:hypothetical protein
MSTTIGCPIPGASQPKEQKRFIDRPMRLIDARKVMIAVFNAIEMDEDEYNAIKAEVDEIPTIDPESMRPKAHWKRIQDVAYMCTYCKSCFAFIPLLPGMWCKDIERLCVRS